MTQSPGLREVVRPPQWPFSPGRQRRTPLAAAAAALLAVFLTLPFAPASAGHDRRSLLPNLVVLPPMDVYVGDGPMGCDVYEQVEQGARRCLRYDSTVINFGRGPLELRYMVDQIGRQQDLVQRVYRADGSFQDHAAGAYEFHPTHAHFHYARFVMARLWRSDAKGAKLGDEPVRESTKNGYCLYDGENYWSEHKRGTEQRYGSEPACRPLEGTPPVQVNGLSVGWGDTYEAALTDQFVEISDVEAGYYLLEVVVDPANMLLESNETDNSAFVHIVLEPSEDSSARLPTARR